MTDETQPAAEAPKPAADDLGFELPAPAKLKKGRGTLLIALAGVVLVGLFLAGFLPRFFARRALTAETEAAYSSKPRVEVFSAKPVTSDRDLELPGSVQALEETVIYARAQGYLKKWLVDLGDKVQEGQLLAEIETPELDSQLEQAKAQLAQVEADVFRAAANKEFSDVALERTERLTSTGVTSQQDLDKGKAQARVDNAGLTVSKSSVVAAQANVRRLAQLKGFSKVTAPFAGTIISRTAERGQLVSGGAANPLFKLAATDPMRVLIDVPQGVAPSIRIGAPAKVTVREYGSAAFEGTVARAAGALDEASRTMTTEVRVPNPENKLLSGMYARVALSLPNPHQLYEIPVTALYNDAAGTRVAVVESDGTVKMKKIIIERDTGQTLQISTGLDGTEKIVKLANAELKDGSEVELIAPPAPEKQAANGGNGSK